MFDVVAVGEMLIDFTPVKSQGDNYLFSPNPGGAPANLLCSLAKFGKRAAFLGKVGDDQFGHLLRKTLEDNHVSTEGMVMSKQYQTTLTFVHLNEHGDRSFRFYRNQGADTMLEPEEVCYELIDRTKIFHFGSLTLTCNPARKATLSALEYAKKAGKIISYDPNLRLSLWDNKQLAKEMIQKGLDYANILKLSEEEAMFLTNCQDYMKAAQTLMERYHNLRIILVTLGANGSLALNRHNCVSLTAYPVKAVDTTAAGDSFFGGFLYQLLELGKPLDALQEEDLISCLSFGNATGSLTTTKKGSIYALPDLQEVKKLMNE